MGCRETCDVEMTTKTTLLRLGDTSARLDYVVRFAQVW
jgi:hypothetical protein